MGMLATKTAKRISVLKRTRGPNGQNIGKQTEAVHIVRSVKKTLIGDKPLSKRRLVGLSLKLRRKNKAGASQVTS